MRISIIGKYSNAWNKSNTVKKGRLTEARWLDTITVDTIRTFQELRESVTDGESW